MTTILITGGTGLIGNYLCNKLKAKGYAVAVLSRTQNKHSAVPIYYWDVEKEEIDTEAIDIADYIIHLAGTNMGEHRWTKKRKKLLIDSRVKSSQLIYNKIKERNKKLKAFISASAIGYYGAITSDKLFNETDAPATDFLGFTCNQWEQAVDQLTELEIRIVKIRTGIVLNKIGGALSKMLIPVKFGIGSALGTGKQYLPWIHIDDLCAIYIKAIEDDQMNGAYNAVAPEHVTNKNFIKTAARVLDKPLWFPDIPSWVVKTIFGKMSEMLLNGSRVSSDKIRNTGFSFKYPELESALNDLIK